MQQNFVETRIPLEKLADAPGVNLFRNAQKISAEKISADYFTSSLVLFDGAAYDLEQELRKTTPNSQERMGILKMLQVCYQKLCVESFLPMEHRSIGLYRDWGYYIRRSVKVDQELSRY